MKKLFAMVATFVMGLSLIACGSGNSNTLTMGCEALTGTFSPIYYSSSYDGYVVDLVYNKLFEYDYDSKLQPVLAESYEEDETSITVKLKKGIKFSDGTKFDAKDVEFTFKAVSDPSYSGRYAGTTKYMLGYSDYANAANIKGKKASEIVEPEFPGVQVIDKQTVKFTFTTPRNDKLTTITSFAMMSYDQFKDDYSYGNTKPLEKAMKKPIGTGAYVLNKWEAGAGASLSKNENYFGDGYKIENVVIKPVEMSTEYQELESGNVDLLATMIEPKKIGPATSNKDLTYNNYPRGGLGYISFNTAAGATSDQAVRQALTFGFDRQSFVDSYYECKKCKGLDGVEIGYVPTTYNNPLSPLGPIITGKETDPGLETYAYDIEKAKATLEAAGWVDTNGDGIREKDGQKLEIKILAIKDHDILNNLIPMWNKSWGEQLGGEVKVATVDFNTLLEKIYADASLNEWNVFFMATSFTSDSMTDILTTYHSDYATENNDNFSRLKDPTLDALLEQGLQELDPVKDLEIWKQVQVRLNEDCAMVPVYGNTYFDIYNKKLKNFETSSLYPWTKALQNATIE